MRTEIADGTFVLEVTNDGVTPDESGQTGMGLRLAGFEALQAGGLLEFGAREQRPLAGAARRPLRGRMTRGAPKPPRPSTRSCAC